VATLADSEQRWSEGISHSQVECATADDPVTRAEWLKISLTTYSLGAFAVALGVATAQMYTTHWVLVNVVALSFAYNAISLIALDSFITGSILLAGLFVYDVWWVFGSQHVFGDNVMVEVATSFDGPIKIVFPRNLAAGRDFTLLGLGDIVLPG
jgi:minor histocompatibility antigen H13